MLINNIKERIFNMSKSKHIFLTHVQGHSNNLWNDIADELAGLGERGSVCCERWEKIAQDEDTRQEYNNYVKKGNDTFVKNMENVKRDRDGFPYFIKNDAKQKWRSKGCQRLPFQKKKNMVIVKAAK